MKRSLFARIAFVIAVAVLLVPRVARAQDAALRACLLLRTPAECGIGNPAPFTAPGDMQSLRVLRPDPMLKAQQESKEPDRFTPLRADVGAETALEKHRQIFNLPLAWNPFRAVSVNADIPMVAQALTAVTDYAIGDIAFGATGRGASGIFSYRFAANGKLPTGDRESGAGSGKVDGFALGEGWLKSGRWSGAASLAFRKNGREDQPDVAQGSIAGQVDVPIGSYAELGCQARAFGHHLTSPTSQSSLYVALGVEPRIIGIAVGYAYVLIPVVDDTPFRTGVTAAAGVILPLGDKPNRPFVDTKAPPPPPESNEPKPEPAKSEPPSEPKPEPKPEPTPERKPEPTPEPTPDPTIEPKPEPAPSTEPPPPSPSGEPAPPGP